MKTLKQHLQEQYTKLGYPAVEHFNIKEIHKAVKEWLQEHYKNNLPTEEDSRIGKLFKDKQNDKLIELIEELEQ